MINRRLLRIKVFKVLFSRIYSGKESYQAAEKELLLSCEKTLDLFYFLLKMPVELRKIASDKIESGLQKFHPTPQEANPNRKFVENKFIAKLDENKELNDYCSKKGLLWQPYIPFLKNLIKEISTKDYYVEYMNSEVVSFSQDKKLIATIIREELEDNEELYEIMEDLNLYWGDDIAYVADVILKSITHVSENGKINFPDVFIKEEDEQYALRLLTHSMLHFDEYVGVMSKFVLNWEPERLAFTDTCLIVLGISEAVAFPSIPLKVTINEFVEISKFYSTQNSKVFVNGILEKVVLGLQKEGKIEKTGRCMVGSID